MVVMKALILGVTILSLSAQTCSKKNDTGIPSCVQQKIDEIKAQPKWNPPAQVEEYIYKGKRVFAFSSNCCDQYNPVYDEACNYICAPSGGMTGKGDRKCEDFATDAKFVRVVWKDER
jgi:predicted transcriptional regulator